MLKVFPVNKIILIDKYTIDNEPISSVDLMERAAYQLFVWIEENFPAIRVNIFVGPGNNGGDGLALARMLLSVSREVIVYVVNPSGKFSPDAHVNLDRLKQQEGAHVVSLSEDDMSFSTLADCDLVVDALFGSGLKRPLSGFFAEVIDLINHSGAKVVAVDIPSGLFGEDNRENNFEAVVKADFTLSFQFPKLSFFMADNDANVGEWEVLDIGLHENAISNFETSWYCVDKEYIKSVLKRRGKFSHKGQFGHALLMAGSYGKVGAAVLASKGCLKAGVGLLTVHLPHFGYQVIQTAVPEAMVSIDRSDILISEFPDLNGFNAIGIGPGIGCKPNTRKALENLFEEIDNQSVVLDADALNIISESPDLLMKLPVNAILTPHPKEFDRLAGDSKSSYDRFDKLVEFTKKYDVVVVLKGAHTVIALPDGQCFFNTSGNPGMATAGSGDVLTGIILGLLAQGYSVHEAAILGVYLHGLSGDIAMEVESFEGLTASDIINYLGQAFLQVHNF